MTTIVQSLFDESKVIERPMTVEQKFEAFCRRNAWFYRELARLTYEARLRGNKRVSMKALFERLREDGSIAEVGPWRLNNSWTALAARRLVELHPDLDGCFELRKRRVA